MRPLRGLQEPRVATREESGVLGFPSRRGMTSRGSLDKNTLEGINSRVSEAQERISELENKMVEKTSEEQNKVKRMKTTEDTLRDLWDNIKCANI